VIAYEYIIYDWGTTKINMIIYDHKHSNTRVPHILAILLKRDLSAIINLNEKLIIIIYTTSRGMDVFLCL